MQLQTKLFERLLNKPFWIWDQQQHKLKDIRTSGDCCFNHIIGLPHKDGIDKPLYDYEEIVFDALVHDYNINGSGNKHLWIKKATGLGMGIDPAWGSSAFGIVVSQWVDDHIEILYAEEFDRPDYNEMLSTVYGLMSKYSVDKTYIDGSAVSFIRSLKL
jgi:hypothetical protein